MEPFVFIPESGVVERNPQSSKKLVRAHVMRNHWQSLQNSKPKPPSKKADKGIKKHDDDDASVASSTPPARSRVKISKSPPIKVISSPVRRHANPRTGPSSKPEARRSQQRKTVQSQSLLGIAASLSEGRMSMDSKSHAFFDHFSQEFNVVLCDPAQPIQPRNSDMFPYMAIHYNFPALAHAMCYMGAIHEALITVPQKVRPTLVQTIPSKSNPIAAGYVINALHHKGLCLEHLRSAFKKPNYRDYTEAIILCIVLLIASETSYGDKANTLVHCKGLCKVVKYFGGMESLPEYLRLHVYLAELKAATSQLRPHFFDLPIHLNQKFNEKDSWAKINRADGSPSPTDGPASSFFTAPLLAPDNQQLTRCIWYARYLHDIQFLEEGPRVKYTISDYIPLEHTLLSLFSDQSLSKIDQCIQAALLLLSNTFFWKPPPFFQWVVSCRKQLYRHLKSLDWPQVLETHPKMLLWMLLMGVHAAHPESFSTNCLDEKEWWETKLRETVAHLQLHNAQEARDMVQGFFYSERLYGWVWQQIWEEEEIEKWSWYPCTRDPHPDASLAIADPIPLNPL